MNGRNRRPSVGAPAEPDDGQAVLKPTRRAIDAHLANQEPLGARVADAVAGFLGSWKFILIQTAVVLVWVVGNIYLLFRFDPYPFILLNLAFSTQAAYAAPLILLATNRAAVRDRLTLEHAAAEADLEEDQNERLLAGNQAVLARVEALENRIVELERSILEAVSDATARRGRWTVGPPASDGPREY